MLMTAGFGKFLFISFVMAMPFSNAAESCIDRTIALEVHRQGLIADDLLMLRIYNGNQTSKDFDEFTQWEDSVFKICKGK